MLLDTLTLGEPPMLRGACGFSVQLDRAPPTTSQLEIGTIGTRRQEGVHAAPPLYARFADALAALNRSVLVIDTRRNGCGGQGNWGPLELASLVPDHWPSVRLKEEHEYMYLHSPILAPSVSLLSRDSTSRKLVGPASDEGNIANAAESVSNGGEAAAALWRHWELFSAAYKREIEQSKAVEIGRALVEHAAARDALAVFLCAEPFVSDSVARSGERVGMTTTPRSIWCPGMPIVGQVAH